MKLVDTKDLKSLPYGSASSSLAEGTRMITMNRFHFIFDKTKKSQSVKSVFLKLYKNYSLSRATFIVVAGGDGFMLNNLKKYYKFNKPFYGINCGSFGFLMNKLKNKDLEKEILQAKKIIINPLILESIDKKNIKRKVLAINEVSLFRQSRQTTSLNLKTKKKNIIKKLIGDGVLVSTPAGSTAYNLSVNGPILNINSGKLAVTPISPFRPRRWRGKIVSNDTIIIIKNLDCRKRPVAAAADNVEIRNIKSVKIRSNKKLKITLLFDKNKSLIKKIKSEKLKKGN